MGEMVPVLNPAQWLGHTMSGWVQFALATPVILWAGRPFFVRGWQSFANRSLNMFSLISLGVGAAFSFSVLAILFPNALPASFRMANGMPPLYFEAAAVIRASSGSKPPCQWNCAIDVGWRLRGGRCTEGLPRFIGYTVAPVYFARVPRSSLPREARTHWPWPPAPVLDQAGPAGGWCGS